jgi:hypothetical protein
MTETYMRQHRKPICDDAETLAGAGTDVRRCSDALGPRKNLHGYRTRLNAHSLIMALRHAPELKRIAQELRSNHVAD